MTETPMPNERVTKRDWLVERLRALPRFGAINNYGDDMGPCVTAKALDAALDSPDEAVVGERFAHTGDPFADWWELKGKWFDPDTSDVPWFDKRKELCLYAWHAASKSRAAKEGV